MYGLNLTPFCEQEEKPESAGKKGELAWKTKKERKVYDRQLKIDAVSLVTNGGRKVREVASGIRRIYAEGRAEYRSPTITEALREEGFRVNHKRIARLMRQIRVVSNVTTKFKRTTKPCRDDLASPSLLNQEFTVTGPNTVWESDMTYVWTLEGWL